MSALPSFASLCFFSIKKWYNGNHTVVDFSSDPRPHFGFSFVLEGHATVEVDGRTEEIFPGEILFVPVGSRYISRWEAGSSNITILFSFFSSTQFPGDKVLGIQKISPRYEGEFTKLFEGADQDFDPAGGYHFSSLSCFFEIMARITPRLLFSKKPKLDERIERVVKHIEEHYNENSTTAELAAVAAMSVSRFHVTFKAQTGSTPIDYRNSIRIRYAIMSLVQGNKTIEAISEALGFESATYFRRIFKKAVGCTPSRYNKQLKGI